MFFYHDGTSVYAYADGISTALCTLNSESGANKILDYLVDGILIYSTGLTGSSSLYLVDGEKIADSVMCYTIYNDVIYYSVWDGLFTYDPVQKNTTQIIATERREGWGFGQAIYCITIQNEKLFLSVFNGFGCANCIFTANPDGSDYKPLINTENPEFQTFTYSEQGFSIGYPFGYTVHFDGGSFYSDYLLMVDLAHDFFIRASNVTFWFDPENEWTVVDGEFIPPKSAKKIMTEQGHEGYYHTSIHDEGFYFSFYLDTFNLIMSGPEVYYDIAEPIFIEMVKSYKILDLPYGNLLVLRGI
jgi:hypothetical protein